MVDIAIKHEEELSKKMMETWFDEKYKFYHYGPYFQKENIGTDTWNSHTFVSVNTNGEVIGFIAYDISRPEEFCKNLRIINFSDDKMTFGMDLMQVLQDIFEKYNFRKLCFSVVIGNPIELSYDKIINKYGGRVVGVRFDHVKLMDNKFYDVKEYEISREEYLKNKKMKESNLSERNKSNIQKKKGNKNKKKKDEWEGYDIIAGTKENPIDYGSSGVWKD